MKNKGFTLIELIAVIVIMGMILLIVFPATARLIRSNENKKYDTYYDAVQEQLELYARTRRDELGGINGKGCADDKKLSELLSYEYIKEFTDEKDVKCLSPGDFSTDKLNALGINTSKQYVNVRIENNKGSISLKYSMICVRNYDDPGSMSLLYSKLVEKESTCENYVPVVTNSLINEIKGKYTVEDVNGVSYVKGTPTNNYVWYSGKMWRIISYNTSTRTIRLASEDIVSIVNYDNKTNTDYINSNIQLWIDQYFLPTLRNTNKYLEDTTWYYGEVAANVSSPITSGNSIVSKVGMLNNYEYLKGSTYLNKGKNFWLISTNNSTSAWYVNTSGTITSANKSSYFGVRPVIVLKPNLTFINGGTGTEANPYKLTGDITANIGTNLNSRYAGEYVTFNGNLFRISSTDAKYTKLVSVNTIPIDASKANTIEHIVSSDYNAGSGTIAYHFFDESYSDNTFIGDYLKIWSGAVEDDLIEGDFCKMMITNTSSQTAPCSQELVINSKYAIPKVGDLYCASANNEYWTINNSEPNKAVVVKTDCSITSYEVGEVTTKHLSAIRPVLVVNNTMTISGGNGTPSSPYTIQ